MKLRYGSSKMVMLAGLVCATTTAVPAAAEDGAADHLDAKLYIFFDPPRLRQALGEAQLSLSGAEARPEKIRYVPFLVAVTTRDCRTDSQGKCNVTVDYQIFDPSGKKVVDDKGSAVWTKPPVGTGKVMFSERPVPVNFDSTDPAGTYRLTATVHDNIARTAVELERTLSLEAVR